MSAAKAQTQGEEMLRMGELARASGVSAATIKHYLREGLLPEPVKTSRNMAYYPAEFVDRIKMIKQLQEERYMPLRVIKDLLEEDPDRAKALIELGDKLLEHALAGESERVSAAEVRHRYDVPQDVLDRLAELEVLTPDKKGYSPSDVRIIEAISRFRAGGYEERIGFTVYDTLRYKEAMGELVKQEVDVLMERLAGEMDPDEAMALIEAGNQPLNDLLAAMHTKALVAELERAARRRARLERQRRRQEIARDGEARRRDAGRLPGAHPVRAGGDPAAAHRQHRPDRAAEGRGPARVAQRRSSSSAGMAMAIVSLSARSSATTSTRSRPLDVDGLHVVGIVLAAAGGLAVFGAQLGMGASWRIGVSEDQGTDLVTGGWFTLCRNPIYTAMIVGWTGFALMVPTWLGFRRGRGDRARARAAGPRRRGAVPRANTWR